MNMTFEEALRRQMEYFRIPGVTATVVKGDEVQYYCLGVKDITGAASNQVDPQTLFTLASLSKSFNTAMLARLVDEGILDWDVPVREYAPELRMMDPEADEGMTLRDMLCHRTGLANHDAIWPSEFSHEEAAKCLRYMKPNQKFRSVSQYNNTIYMLSGYVAEAATGKTWHELIKEYIFDPLGMTHSCSELSKMVASGNFAEPHKYLHGKVQKVDRWPMDQAAAAAGVNSCAEDMAKWLKFHLTGGLGPDGTRLLSEKNFNEIHKGEMPSSGSNLHSDEIKLTQYALGWREGTYRGHRISTHTGHIEGYCSIEMVLPADGIGVFISLNQHDGCYEVHQRAAYTAIDNLLGYEKNWLTNVKEEGLCPDHLYLDCFIDHTPLAKYYCSKTYPLDALTGTYVSQAYGPLRIFERDGKLYSAYHFKEDELLHKQGTTYVADGFLEDTYFMKMPFEFVPEENSAEDAPAIRALMIPLELTVEPIEFVKAE